ncbi:hypothetical protein Q8814_25510, partial [Rhodococcus sp. CC-R104]|nr:hypothetical protein [Rhodococcus sp. CC-R104]
RKFMTQPMSTFSAGVGRTVDGTLDEALAGWEAAARQRVDVAGRTPVRALSTSSTSRWRYRRCAFADDTRVEVTIGETASGKCRIAVSHNRLISPVDVESLGEFWRLVLADVRV